MIIRVIIFLSAAAYLAAVGRLGLAALSLTGLIRGVPGLLGAVAFTVALFATGHYVLGLLVAAAVAVVFWMSNPQWRPEGGQSMSRASPGAATEPVQPRSLADFKSSWDQMAEDDRRAILVGAREMAETVRVVADNPPEIGRAHV